MSEQMPSESEIRFLVRRRYREEGVLGTYQQYPIGSLERGYALSEGQKILQENFHSALANTGEM